MKNFKHYQANCRPENIRKSNSVKFVRSSDRIFQPHTVDTEYAAQMCLQIYWKTNIIWLLDMSY